MRPVRMKCGILIDPRAQRRGPQCPVSLASCCSMYVSEAEGLRLAQCLRKPILERSNLLHALCLESIVCISSCAMQADVDQQDDMPDFSKTDAYRSNKTRQSEEMPRAAASQQVPSAGQHPSCDVIVQYS